MSRGGSYHRERAEPERKSDPPAFRPCVAAQPWRIIPPISPEHLRNRSDSSTRGRTSGGSKAPSPTKSPHAIHLLCAGLGFLPSDNFLLGILSNPLRCDLGLGRGACVGIARRGTQLLSWRLGREALGRGRGFL